jgi:hypothetical protein
LIKKIEKLNSLYFLSSGEELEKLIGELREGGESAWIFD